MVLKPAIFLLQQVSNQLRICAGFRYNPMNSILEATVRSSNGAAEAEMTKGDLRKDLGLFCLKHTILYIDYIV